MLRKKDGTEFKTGVTWLLWSSVLALVTLSGWSIYVLMLRRSPDPIPIHLLTVERDTVETVINESGTVQLRGQQTLKSPAEGAVDQVFVQPGDRVKQGQVLLTLRNPERQTALADQQLKISQQEIALTRNRQQIVETREQLAADQQRLQTLAALAQDGALAQTEVQDQEKQARNTRTALRTAEADASTASLELESLQLERKRIQQQLQDTVITAPLNSIILGVNVQNGDGVQFRTELLTLGDPTQELVQLQLSTLNAAQVRINQLARISVIGPNPQIFTGHVQSLYPQATFANSQDQSGESGASSQATVPTTVRLDQPTRTLIPGGQVSVEIVIEQRKNVVTLSPEAIQRSSSSPFVWVRDENGRAKQQLITLGLEGLTEVEIISGLHPGDQVVVPLPERPLKAGIPLLPDREP